MLILILAKQKYNQTAGTTYTLQAMQLRTKLVN